MIEFLKQPWAWYVAGPLIGLTVPALLILGNKTLGISSSLRHVCAACIPAKIPFFSYDWKKEAWNLFFVAGIILGAVIVAAFISNPNPVEAKSEIGHRAKQLRHNRTTFIVAGTAFQLATTAYRQGLVLYGVRWLSGRLRNPVCRWLHFRSCNHGFIQFAVPSLIATISFMAGGFIMANLILPFILKL